MTGLQPPSKPLSRATFARFRELIHSLSGIALGDGKEGLVRARVGRRMRALGLERYEDYLDRVLEDPSGAEAQQLIDFISTNVTSFFRETEHFEALARLTAGRSRLRLWSAACSTGEEPYSMAMTLPDVPDLKILATDLSTRVLAHARAGSYAPDRLAGLSLAQRREHFRSVAGRAQVLPELRRAVTFAQLNLAEIPYPMSGPFDAVFCRNVMIYFDVDVRRRVLAEIRRLLRPGGHLFVGHAESLTGLARGLRAVGPSIYVKEGA